MQYTIFDFGARCRCTSLCVYFGSGNIDIFDTEITLIFFKLLLGKHN